MKRDGQCLCGEIRVSAEVVNGEIVACHCGQCRTWAGGGPGLAVKVVDVEMTGEPKLFHASEWGERGFCKTCGTNVFWRMQGKPTSYMHVGMFSDTSGFVIRDEIFADRRQEWQPAIEGARQSREAEELALLAEALAEKKS